MGRPPRQVNWTELGESAAGSPHSFMFGGRSGLRADRVCEGGVRGRGGAGGALWRPGRRHCRSRSSAVFVWCSAVAGIATVAPRRNGGRNVSQRPSYHSYDGVIRLGSHRIPTKPLNHSIVCSVPALK